MSFHDNLKQLFGRGPPEEPFAPLMRELNQEEKQLFHDYEEMRGQLKFAEAMAALQSLLARDNNEKHREFYLVLIDEMKIYLSSPEYMPKTKPDTFVPDNLTSERGIQIQNGTINYISLDKGKIGYQWKRKDD
jgi:hypothetical protein